MHLLFLLACSDAPPVPTPVPDPVVDVVEEPPAEILPEPTEPKYAATHILVAWKGAVRAAPGVTRSPDEAEALARELRARIVAGEPIEALARKHSDGPSAPRGGSLGVYLTGTMVPDFESAVASVAPGQVGPVVKTPFGWHVVRRDAVREARASHILVSWKGAHRSKQTRSKDEAKVRIGQARKKIQAGASFASVAKSLSDDSTRLAGGDLGPIAPGQMLPVFEEAVFDLKVGEISNVVESAYGYHLILRTE